MINILYVDCQRCVLLVVFPIPTQPEEQTGKLVTEEQLAVNEVVEVITVNDVTKFVEGNYNFHANEQPRINLNVN